MDTQAPGITTLNIDDVQYEVAELPVEIQQLVQMYNNWGQREAGFNDELLIIRAAKETLSQQIINNVRKSAEDSVDSADQPVVTTEPTEDQNVDS